MPNFLRSLSQCRLTRLLFILSIAVFVIISLWHLRVSRQDEQELIISGHNMELPTRVERLVDEGSPIPAYPSHHDGWDAASSPAPRAMSDRLDRVQRYCGAKRPSLPISVADIPANSTNLSWCSVSSPASAQWTSIMTQPSYNGRCQGSNSFQNCHVFDRDNQTQGRSYSFLITGHPFERIVSVYHMLFEVMCKQHAEICHRNFIQFGRQILYDQRDPHHHTDQEKRALLSSAADFIQSGLSELHYDRNNPYHNPPFPTFIEFSAAILSGGLSDELWEPLFTLCSPCSFHYLAVVDLATFSRDTHYIIQTLGLPPQSIVGDTPPSALAWEPVFLSLPSDLQRRYKEFYLADCQLLGYDCGVVPAAPPPSSQGVVPTHHELAGSKTPYSRVGGHIDQHDFPCEPSAIFRWLLMQPCTI